MFGGLGYPGIEDYIHKSCKSYDLSFGICWEMLGNRTKLCYIFVYSILLYHVVLYNHGVREGWRTKRQEEAPQRRRSQRLLPETVRQRPRGATASPRHGPDSRRGGGVRGGSCTGHRRLRTGALGSIGCRGDEPLKRGRTSNKRGRAGRQRRVTGGVPPLSNPRNCSLPLRVNQATLAGRWEADDVVFGVEATAHAPDYVGGGEEGVPSPNRCDALGAASPSARARLAGGASVPTCLAPRMLK